MKLYYSDYAIGKSYGSIQTINGGIEKREYKTGTYTCKNGVVTIYSEPKFSTFSFVFNNRVYGLSVSDTEKFLSDRQLINRAGKFAREVVKKEMNKKKERK